METVCRPSNFADALADFLVALEQGLYNATASGSHVEMPAKVQITGFWSYAENAVYLQAVDSTPESTKDDTQTNEQAITIEEQETPLRTESDVVVEDAATDYSYESTPARTVTRSKGLATNSETTTHPTQITTFAKGGHDDSDVTYFYETE